MNNINFIIIFKISNNRNSEFKKIIDEDLLILVVANKKIYLMNITFQELL